jgi:hypothetical protein
MFAFLDLTTLLSQLPNIYAIQRGGVILKGMYTEIQFGSHVHNLPNYFCKREETLYSLIMITGTTIFRALQISFQEILVRISFR